MATKIKVKKITDLTKIFAEQGTDPDNSKVIFSGDQLVVAHKTNVDDAGGGIMHSTAMEVQELLKYISKQLESKYMTLDAGGQLSSLIETKLHEAEDNMAKGNDVYSSNYFVDDAGVLTFTDTNREIKGNDISGWYTNTYVFKSTCVANVHLTIYCGTQNQSSVTLASSVGKPNAQAYAKIQMFDRSGDWKTICQQPLQCADSAFDIDLHGYFFAGTKLRGYIEQYLPSHNVIFSMSNMQVTRFSSESGFSNKSFDWWVSNNGALTSDMNPPADISAPGFLSFTGLYWTTTRDGTNSTNTIVGSKATDYIFNRYALERHYCTNAVYANVCYGNGTQYVLGSTENDNIAYTPNSGINDDFSGKYYYINPSNSNYASAFTTTDFMFKDDPKAPKADSGGGFRNATLIKYTDYDEISTVVGTYTETDDTGKSETKPNKVYNYGEITAKYNSSAAGYKAPHKFGYSGGLGYYISADANNCSRFYPYAGADQRNIAALEITQYTDSVGCYVKESQDSWIGGSGAAGIPPDPKYVFLPTSLGSQRIRSVIRDDDPNRWILNTGDNRWCTPVNYKIDVLNENVEYIGVGKDITKYQTAFNPVSSFPSANVIDNWLTAEVSAGWALTGVTLASADVNRPLTVKDFAFAACPRLSSFEFPANTAATGIYTFAAPSKTLNYIEAGGNYGGTNKLSIITPKAGTAAAQNMSHLTSVAFHISDDCGPCTHIEGYAGHPGETVAMFSNCRNLEKVNLEDTDIQNLGTYSFLNCTSLTSIEIPQTCTGLGASVFEGCSSLTSITFPSTLQSFKRAGKLGTASVVDFKSCSPNMINKNTTTAALGKDGYLYKLGDKYAINIKLRGASNDYRGDDGSLDSYRANIFPEISALVNYLNMQGLGATTNTVFKTDNQKKVTGITTYGAGRRYYLLDKNGYYVNLNTSDQTDRTNNNNLTFNTIATADKVPVQNMIVQQAGTEDTWTGKQVTEAYCIMYC